MSAKKLTTEQFIEKAIQIHGQKYDYSLVDYQGAHTKVTIICPIHGEFLQTANDHKQAKGCAKCALQTTGWTRTKFKDRCVRNNNGLGILYVLECFNDNETFIKIGITSNSIKRRYTSKSQMPYNYKILHELVADPEVIYDLETLLHKKSKHYKYVPATSFAGSSTECFLSDKDYIQKLNTYINKLNNITIRSNNAE
jgi:hypothetical protein